MPTVILARHGRTTANSAGVLAGRAAGVHLDDTGRNQATAAAQRLAGITLAAVVSSPMLRCRQTAALLAPGAEVVNERGLIECDYGDWSGRALRTLAKETLWSSIQRHPSGVTFPGGESMGAMSARAVAAIRRWDAQVARDHGPEAVWLAVSHGDVIKAIIADALGMHLDGFQRIVVDPASLSVIAYTPQHPLVLSLNTTAGSLAHLQAKRRGRRRPEIGGGAGPATP